jgi:hypothetical protein
MGGARMVEEEGELELGDELHEGKPQEPLDGVRMGESELDPLDGCPSCRYIEFGARACTKKKVLSTEGS